MNSQQEVISFRWNQSLGIPLLSWWGQFGLWSYVRQGEMWMIRNENKIKTELPTTGRTFRSFICEKHVTLKDYNDAHITIDRFSSNWAAKFSNEEEDFPPKAFPDQKNVPNALMSWSQALQRKTAV